MGKSSGERHARAAANAQQNINVDDASAWPSLGGGAGGSRGPGAWRSEHANGSEASTPNDGSNPEEDKPSPSGISSPTISEMFDRVDGSMTNFPSLSSQSLKTYSEGISQETYNYTHWLITWAFIFPHTSQIPN